MKYYQEVCLKDGRTCILRNGSVPDAAEVLKNFNLTHGETEFLASYPEESTLTIPKEEKFLSTMEESEKEAEICAVLDGKIVGTAGLNAVRMREKMKHRASMGISVEKAFWGLGIGRALTAACIECAQMAGYVQLELEVVSTNERAVSLYKSLGFEEYGRNPKGLRTRSGEWQELILMRLELS